jgi:hypothetical protein
MSEVRKTYYSTTEEEREQITRYLDTAVSDPVRVSILIGHGVIEDAIDDFIREAVPHYGLLKLDRAEFARKSKWARLLDDPANEKPFWNIINAFNELRNAAAHRNLDEKRDASFAELRRKVGDIFPESVFQHEQSFVRFVVIGSFTNVHVARKDYLRQLEQTERGDSRLGDSAS